MRIAYLTLDEVNGALARRLAADCGATLEAVVPGPAEPDGRFDARLYDLDHVPAPRRQEVLARYLSGPAACPVAIHGYGLEEPQADALRRHGLAVARALEPEVFW